MIDKNRHTISVENQMIIPTTRQLWKYLLKGRRKNTKMSTRVEAFYDLIDRQQTALLSERKTLSENLSELAKRWRWNRDTTAAFLTNLEQLGAVTIDMKGNRKTVRMNCITLTKDSSGAL